MILEQVANDIYSSREFSVLYDALLQKELDKILNLKANDSPQLPFEGETREFLTEEELDIVLECAVVLATVKDDCKDAGLYHDTAYRIAILLRHHYEDYASCRANEIYIIFSRLGRYPIAEQYFDGKSKNIHNVLPIMLFGPEEFSKNFNSVEIGKQEYVLTNFQKKFWQDIHQNQQLAVSAPTSAGKSFILTQYLVSRYFNEPSSFVGVYVIPTNALVNEVSDKVLEFSKDNFDGHPTLFTTSTSPSGAEKRKIIYILTQEKLSALIAKAREEESDFVIDLLIVDEAQIIADGERGGITKTVVEDVLLQNNSTQIILGSPPIQNLEGYGKFFQLPHLETYPETISPVTKNLIRIHKKYRDKKNVNITADFGNKSLSREGVKIPEGALQNIPKSLALFAVEYGSSAPSLIYTSGSKQCINVAEEILNCIPESEGNRDNSRNIELSNFIAEHIHPEFKLVEYVKKGVGFHFGALPSILTKQLEEKFRNLDFSFLVSTSTLLHGVNLPAKNLFLCKPKKGTSEKLDDIEFSNLIGRAGRLGKDFQGNIFIIENDHETENVSLWSPEYIERLGQQVVESSLDRCLKVNADTNQSNIVSCLDGLISGEKEPEFLKSVESTLSQLFYYQRTGKLKEALGRTTINISTVEIDSIINKMENLSDSITVSTKLLNKHREISPIRIQRLYDSLTEYAANGQIIEKNKVPKHPLNNEDSISYNSLESIFRTLCQYFDVGGSTSRQGAMANLAFRWMQGENYNSLAEQHLQDLIPPNNDSEDSSQRITDEIYKCFRVLQREISYEYAKYMRCYIDVLELVNAEAACPFLEEGKDLPPIHSYLEDGTYIISHLSLIQNGLSRMTAIEVYQILANFLGKNADTRLTHNIVMKNSDILQQKLHPYFYNEVKKVFAL